MDNTGSSTVYDGTYSITFGDGRLNPAGHEREGQLAGMNTWDDWHLIPSSRPTVAQAGVTTNLVEIPGRAIGPVDLSDYLTGEIVYTTRQGSFEFLVDNGHEHWETLKYKIVSYLHGKKLKMSLTDDPDWVYGGRFSLNEWRSEPWNSKIVIDYVLSPYKLPITYNALWEWDPFNFDEDQTDITREGRL